jgi:hypothetical protein
MSDPDQNGGTWTLLTGHGHVLVEIARNPKARIRDISPVVGQEQARSRSPSSGPEFIHGAIAYAACPEPAGRGIAGYAPDRQLGGNMPGRPSGYGRAQMTRVIRSVAISCGSVTESNETTLTWLLPNLSWAWFFLAPSW